MSVSYHPNLNVHCTKCFLMSADISDALWFILNFLVDLSPWVDSRTLPLLPPAAERKHKLGTGSSSLSTNQKAGKPGGERNGQ